MDKIVIFAGAGCSMAPPSSLPGWNDLNDAILETLWDRLEDHRITKGFREKILTSIKEKRSENKFPPDYQAQLMEEQVGMNYFKLLSAVDSDAFNPIQYYTALLSRAGLVKAVVTTNFDQNFEHAFSKIGIAHQDCFDEKGFLELTNNWGDTVPIIKIHGSCTSPPSMVDTRKQRLKGRSKVLKTVLGHLIRNHHFIFVGFSGQDFNDNDNYLGFKEAAPEAKGFTYTRFPGSSMAEGMIKLIQFYGEDKAEEIEYDPALYLEELLVKQGIEYAPFQTSPEKKIGIREKLEAKIAKIEPMEAINMLTSLAESYGDEVSARFLYDKIWKNRNPSDYKGDGLSRFLLNYGRSFVVNFQSRLERADSAGVQIRNIPLGEPSAGYEDYLSNPAKQNLRHIENKSAETIGLIALAQTYMGNPVLFDLFPDGLTQSFTEEPSLYEVADIMYYYSLYVMIYGKMDESNSYLNTAIKDMEAAYDEPRISRLLSRRALIKLRYNNIDMIKSGEQDAIRARKVAEKYHEPNLLALSSLALATCARANNRGEEAHKFIGDAVATYKGLLRIPQYIESLIEELKIIHLRFQSDKADKPMLLDRMFEIKELAGKLITERINVFEPEYCYLIGMIMINFTTAPKTAYLPWFIDAVSLAQHNRQASNYAYFKETCAQLNILNEVEQIISDRKA